MRFVHINDLKRWITKYYASLKTVVEEKYLFLRQSIMFHVLQNPGKPIYMYTE
jgi:hypothetical protein